MRRWSYLSFLAEDGSAFPPLAPLPAPECLSFPLSRLPLSSVSLAPETPSHLPIPPRPAPSPPRQPAWEIPTTIMGCHASGWLSTSQAMHVKVPLLSSSTDVMQKEKEKKKKASQAPSFPKGSTSKFSIIMQYKLNINI